MNKYTQTTKTSTSANPARRRKTEGYNSATLHAKRDSRRIEAEDRQRACEALTLQERLARIDARRGASAREWERLTGDRLKGGSDRSKFNLS